VKHLSELNETIYIPIDFPDKLNFFDDLSSRNFISNVPCMNGNTMTCEGMSSMNLEEFSLKRKNKISTGVWDKHSPGLKKALFGQNNANNAKVCFYEKNNPHKISNFLDFNSENNKNMDGNRKSSNSNENEGTINDLSPLSPFKKFSPHKTSNFLEYLSKN